MSLEESFARIATALEVIADKLGNPLVTAETTSLDKVEKVQPKAKPETKPEKTETKEKPKFDFNKEIRAPFIELLNTVKADPNLGPKGATQLAVKLLQEYTTDPGSPLSAKTLPEDKYEEFIADVKGRLEKLKAGDDDNEELPGV